MIKLSKHFTDINKHIFVFSGDVKYLFIGDTDPERFIEIYEISTSSSKIPSRMLSEVFVYTEQKAYVRLYNCEKVCVEKIINTELEGYEIEYQDANYIFDKNRWLMSFLEEGDVKVMKIDDEHLTYDGQYLYEERIFNENRLIEVREYYRDKNGNLAWETESYTDE